MSTPEEKNIQMLAGRTSRFGRENQNPDVALAAMCVLPFLDRIATELTRIADALEKDS